jgi:flagellar assembly factor FliW
MQIKTAHFGNVEFDPDKKFVFADGLPGLEDEKEFALLSHEKSEPICWLQSLVNWEIALPVLNPFLVCPTYSFDITDEDVETLKIQDIKSVCVLNVLVIPKDVNEMTINLVAPIIVNIENHQGRQIFLDDKKYKIRTKVKELIENISLTGNNDAGTK